MRLADKTFMAGLAILLVAFMATSLHSQNGFSASQFFIDSIPGSLASCPAPVTGHDKLCDVTGVGFEQSINGAAYAPIGAGSVGPIGPAGPTGATGATGPQGPQGIPGTQWSKYSCSTWSGGSASLSASGCVPQ